MQMTELIQTIANIATAVAAITAAKQLILTHKQAVTTFEDTLAREYRELAAKLPPEAFYGQELAAEI